MNSNGIAQDPVARPPRVSVIIPNYNHERYLAQRIDSVLGQTFQDMEVIILDDASTDGSLKVIDRYRPVEDAAASASHALPLREAQGKSGAATTPQDHALAGAATGESRPSLSRDVAAADTRWAPPAKARVRLIANSVNSGCAFRQWNRGVREARGEYVWIAESDDYADARLLETLVSRLDARPTAGLAYCDSFRVNAAGEQMGECKEFNERMEPGRWQTDFEADGRDQVRRSLVFYNSIPNASAVLLRRAVYERVGGAAEDLRLCGDWLTWVKIMLVSDLMYVAAPLNFFRWHGASVRSASGDLTLCREQYAVLAYVMEHLDLSPREHWRACTRGAAGWACAILEQPSWSVLRESRDVLRAAAKADPHALMRLVVQMCLHYPRRLRERVRGREAPRPVGESPA